MEVYKSESREIIRRYLTGQISRDDCVNSLEAAVAGLIPFLKMEDVPEVLAVISETTETLAKEMKHHSDTGTAR
jgi:hypothetical protein